MVFFCDETGACSVGNTGSTITELIIKQASVSFHCWQTPTATILLRLPRHKAYRAQPGPIVESRCNSLSNLSLSICIYSSSVPYLATALVEERFVITLTMTLLWYYVFVDNDATEVDFIRFRVPQYSYSFFVWTKLNQIRIRLVLLGSSFFFIIF